MKMEIEFESAIQTERKSTRVDYLSSMSLKAHGNQRERMVHENLNFCFSKENSSRFKLFGAHESLKPIERQYEFSSCTVKSRRYLSYWLFLLGVSRSSALIQQAAVDGFL